MRNVLNSMMVSGAILVAAMAMIIAAYRGGAAFGVLVGYGTPAAVLAVAGLACRGPARVVFLAAAALIALAAIHGAAFYF